MSFDPRSLGCRCDECPLRTQREGPPVPSEWPAHPTALIVGEAPGADEVKRGAPFVGKAGLELMSALAAVGIRRSQIALTNVVSCRPPENEYDKLVHQIQKLNKRREAAGEDLIPTPAQCCRPRLLREIEALPRVIPVGAVAHHAVIGTASIMAARGGPREVAIDLGDGKILPVRALPTLHPAFVMRSRRWRAAFRADLGRAFRWFSSGLSWRDPDVLYAPKPEELRRFLASIAHDPIIVWDVETFAGYQDHFEPMADKLKCIGIGVARGIAAVVPFRSIEGRVYYTPEERPEILQIMRGFLSSPDFKKGGWNCLHAGTRVVLADGSTAPIERIVRAKAKPRVRALLPDGTIGTTEITGWIRETVPDQKWIVVRTAQAKKHARGLTLTPEHRVFTQRGWIPAADLRIGDRMHFDEPLLSSAQRSAMLGTALGDSTIRKSPTIGSKIRAPSLKLYGGHTSREFVQEKITHLAPHAVAGPAAAAPPRGRFAASVMWPFATSNLRQLADFGPLLFDEDGTRRLRIEALKQLGVIGLAWWFMDDGNKNRRPEGDGRFESLHLAACRYSQADVIAAAAWLASHFGEVHADGRGATDPKRRIIHFSVKASAAFAEFIGPFVFPSQRYKLPRGDWPPFVPIAPPPLRPCSLPIVSVEEWIPPPRDREAHTLWCISTTTENFFTTFGLVHNSRYYDRMVAEAQLGVTPAPQIDGIMVHRVAEPEIPHNLAYSGSVQTDVHNWKAGHIATTAKSDRELHLYCATDTIVTAMAIPPLVQVARDRKQEHLIPVFHRLQDICVGLHKTGLPVDQAKRREWDRKLLKQADEHRKRIRELSGYSALNPASFPQIADLLFERLQIAPHHYTDLGDPSTDDDALRAFLSETWGLDERRKNLVSAIRDFRRVTKRRGVVVRLRPLGEDVIVGDDLADYSEEGEGSEQRAERLEMERERKKKGKARAPGLVLPDGRVHADWNPHGTTGWRMSSSNPNCFDAATEILTPRGWIRFPDLRNSDRVAQWSDGCVSFVEPTRIVSYEHTGSMVTIRNQHIDLRVTSDHRCLVRHRKTSELRVFPADQFPSDWQQIHGGRYAGPGLGLSEDEITVICAMQADGTWTQRENPRRPWLRFTKARKIARLRSALNRLEAKYEETTYGGAASFRITDDRLIELLDHLLGVEKTFGVWILQCDARELDSFANEFFLWDGCVTRMNHYSSSNRVNADLVQAVLSLRGWRARMRTYTPPSGRPNYQIDVTRRDYSLTTNATRKIEQVTSEPVYCVSVPSSYVVVRRGQNVMVTGQCQNLEDKLRDIFVAPPGMLFVACDSAQVELRFVAGLANCKYYIDRFKAKADPHRELCIDVFGDPFLKASPSGQKKLRRCVKELTYSSLYMAEDKTKHEVVTSAEDSDTETLLFPDFTLREVSAFSQAWFRRCPEIPEWWDALLVEWQKNGYLAEPIMGLKCDFLDGAGSEGFRNRLANYKPQSGGSGALTHLATFRAMERIPFGKWGPGTGMVQQGHDSIVFQIPMDHPKWEGDGAEFGWCAPGCKCRANRAARFLEECMSFDGRKYGMDVDFCGEAKVGRTLKAV